MVRFWNDPATLRLIAIAVVALVVLGIGAYYLSQHGPNSNVTLSGVMIHYANEGNITGGGGGWFGPYNQAQTNGYPILLGLGASFQIPIGPVDYDHLNHTVLSISVSAPFTLTGTNPPLPLEVVTFYDTSSPLSERTVDLNLTAPSTQGSWTLDVTLQVE
ncbi:MAG: hypothetical protein L3K03_00060 [Thermoplasmata archaeon]|nr:hypothetical protein [Thermoplasmata archaeon]